MLGYFNLDVIIFIGFLVVNLAVGLLSSRNIKGIREYALGGRNFSTATISATIVATWIAGSSLTIKVSETYNNGLYFILANLADPVSMFVIGFFLAPRMVEFLGKLSVAEAMGELYGAKVRGIAAAASICASIGCIGLQIKVISLLLNYFFQIGSLPAIIITMLVLIGYSAFGGIKAVTFTDTIQIFTFGVFIPSLAMVIWGTFNDPYVVSKTITENPLFDLQGFFSFDNPKLLGWTALFLYNIIPGVDPAIFQRISMSKNVAQVRQSFYIAAAFIVILCLLMYFIGILLLSANQHLNTSDLIGYLIDTYSYPGLKGLTIVGIIAMAMSTADSYINSAAILAAHDLPESFGMKIQDKRKLMLSRIFSVAIGIVAIIPALSAKSMLKTLISFWAFYMSVVTVPLIFAILGFRTTSKPVLIGMFFGVITVIAFNVVDTGIDSAVPGMIASIAALFGSHYLLRQPGGWVGIKDDSVLKIIRAERHEMFKTFFANIKNFNIITFCKNNRPIRESTYSFFGLFCIISIFSSMYSIPVEIRESNQDILDMIYHTVLISSTIFLSYPIWPPTFKNDNFISILWISAIIYTLVIASTLLVIFSNFEQLQLMIFMINLIIISIMLRWQVALAAILIGTFAAMQFCRWYLGLDIASDNVGDLQFKVIYALLLISSVLIAFLKPKQERQELADEKVDYLMNRINDYREELSKATELKYEFMRNLQHEARTPITGITSMAQAIDESYDRIPEAKRRQAIHDMAMNSEKLESYVNNLIDLSKLSSMGYDLNVTTINLSDMVRERLERCKKFYIAEKNKDDREFIVEIEPNIMVACDEYYIGRSIENVIINAIQFCKDCMIEIKLSKTATGVEFSVKDNGVGIPEEYMKDIFGAFTTSAKTKTPAGGRGIGLALAKKVMDLHKGTIKVESDGKSWTHVTCAW